MKTFVNAVAVGAAVLLCLADGRAFDAQVILGCVSVRLHPATYEALGRAYTLEATTAMDGTINGEIGISDNPDTTRFYSTTLVFTDLTWFMTMYITCDLDVPDPGDSNINGISDFFEADRAVQNVRSDGEFLMDDGMDVLAGTVDLVWNRSAGTATGTCDLRLRIPDYGVDMTFKHSFEIYDYRGTYAYTVHEAEVTGQMTLTRLGGEGSYVGAWPLTRVDQWELQFPQFSWTNETGNAIQFLSSAYMEIPLYQGMMHGTNYYTILGTGDGWPDTGTYDEYMVWLLNLFDANDTDGDGIPNLSDTPGPAEPPRLAIRIEGQQAILELTAETEREAAIEQTAKLLPADWASVATFTVTNRPHRIEMPMPGAPVFWRARVE